MNYIEEYQSIKGQWESLVTKKDLTADEKKVLARIEVLGDIVAAIEDGRMGAIPRRFADCTLETFTADSKALLAAKSLIERKIESLASGRNVVIRGPVGVGKTHLAVAIAWELMLTKPRQSVDFIPIVDFVQLAKDIFDGDERARRYIEELRSVDWVIVDDLGQERPTEWTRELVYSLVSRRYNARRPIIVTTNLTPTEIAGRYGDAVASRLFGEGAVVISFKAEDHRLKGGHR